MPDDKSEIQQDFEDKLTSFRKDIEQIGKQVLELKNHQLFNSARIEPGIVIKPYSKEADINEMMANIMLTYRKLEDARMRIGKVFQALDGGKSVYNR